MFFDYQKTIHIVLSSAIPHYSIHRLCTPAYALWHVANRVTQCVQTGKKLVL